MPSLNVVDPASGAVLAVTELGALNYYVRRGWKPQSGSVGDAQAVFTGNPAEPTALSAAFGSVGSYLPERSGPTGLAWGEATRTKLAAAGLGTVAVHGDSISQGAFASSLRTKSWVGLLQTALAAKWGDGGSGFFGTMNSATALTAVGMAASAVTAYGDAGELWTLTGTWSGAQNNGPGFQNVRTFTIGDTAVTPAGAVRGRYVDICARVPTGSASFTYAIDGGAPVTVTGTAGIRVISVDTGSAPTATHTVTITNTTAQQLDLLGVRGRNTAGALVDRYATYGARTSSMSNADGNRSGSWSGGANGPGSPADLLVYVLGANDAAQAVAPDTSVQQLSNDLYGFTDNTFGGTPNPAGVDVLFVLPHVGKFDHATTPMWRAYKSRVVALCRAEGYAYVDLGALGRNSWAWLNAQGYTGSGATPGAAGTDAIHLSDTGHAWMRAQVATLLGRAALL